MKYLIPLLFVASAVAADDAVDSAKCELRMGGEILRTIKSMRTLRTIDSHENGAPTPALRAVLDAHLAGVFDDDVRAQNGTPLPIFEIKAEMKLPAGSRHKLMLLRTSRDAAPAVVVHEEHLGKDEAAIFKTMPLGEPAVRELREALLEAYQIEDPLSPRLSDANQFALFAEDRFRLDRLRRNGLQETGYQDVLEVAVKGHRHGEEWRILLRREDDRTALLRLLIDDEYEELQVFKAKKYRRARLQALNKVEARLLESNSSEDVVEIFIGQTSDRAEMSIGKVMLERNVPGRALRLPGDELTEELLVEWFGSTDHESVHRVRDGETTYYLVRAAMGTLVDLIMARLETKI